MASTLTDLVQRTITRLSMVPGVGVQVYSEDRIAEMVEHKFHIVRDELWWDDFMVTVSLTQSATGVPNENVVRELPTVPVGNEIVINQYKDIQYVWTPSKPHPLPEFPRRTNPSAVMRVGSTVYRSAHANKVIQLLPYTPGQTFFVRYKKWYKTFLPNDVVPMDDQLLILGCCYDFLEDDGTNPGQTEKFRNFYNARLAQITAQENDGEIPIAPRTSGLSSGYQVVP